LINLKIFKGKLKLASDSKDENKLTCTRLSVNSSREVRPHSWIGAMPSGSSTPDGEVRESIFKLDHLCIG
jgi:hypothetical protein